MKTRFKNHIASIHNHELALACIDILDCQEFFSYPASLSHHHAYEGGLLAHTVEVVDMALHAYAGHPAYPKNRDILIAAALYHDFCKVKEYEVVEELSEGQRGLFICHCDAYTQYFVKRNSLFGDHAHIVQGTIEFTVAARKHGVSEDVIEQVQHCILAHHGRKEWGSPVEPQTLEALILSQSDLLSAKYGASKEVYP